MTEMYRTTLTITVPITLEADSQDEAERIVEGCIESGDVTVYLFENLDSDVEFHAVADEMFTGKLATAHHSGLEKIASK